MLMLPLWSQLLLRSKSYSERIREQCLKQPPVVLLIFYVPSHLMSFFFFSLLLISEIRCVFPEVQGVKKATSGNTYRFGTNITLECDDGYMLEGISQIQCQEDFSWDPPVPACKLSK